MLNWIWLGLLLVAVLLGGFTGHMGDVVSGAVAESDHAVKLAFALIGIMAVWLGLMRLAEKAGLVQSVARGLRPILRWLFPDVPVEHPAMGSMVMNIAANMLGLSNAATPLGLRAMRDLESINPTPGVASNAMCTFLALNTSSVQLIPMTAIAILAASGARAPTAIVGTALLSSLCAATAAVIAVKSLARLPRFRLPKLEGNAAREGSAERVHGADEEAAGLGVGIAPAPLGWPKYVLLGLFITCFAWFFSRQAFPSAFGLKVEPAGGPVLMRMVNAVSLLAIPFLLAFFPLYAALRGVAVYEEFVEGAKEGFQVALRIIPFLVAMLVAIGVFRSAGGVDFLTRLLRPALDWIRFPAELVPLTLMRPLSGSASLGILSELVKQSGPDSLLARTACTLYGSTETTFYVVAVYFGSVSVKRTRHAIPAGLIADATGALAAVAICRMVFH